MTRATLLGWALAAAVALPAGVHGQEAAALSVRTFKLHHLSPRDAALLVSPYIQSKSGGVYEVGGDLRAITVRESPPVLARIDSLLREDDRPTRTIVLHFQLVAAIDTSVTDPALSSVDAPLHSLFRFAGYRMLAEGTAMTSEFTEYALTMSGGAQRYQISGHVEGVEAVDGQASVGLGVELGNNGANETQNGAPQAQPGLLFRTGLTTPLGKTLVVGSAAGGLGVRALILVVRPELLEGSPARK